VRHLIACGRWQVPHLGIYVAHNGPVTDNQFRWVAVLASRGYIAGVSALGLLGLRGFTTPHLHLLVPGHRRDDNPPHMVRIHRTSALPHSERGMVDNLPCTVPARAVVDAAQWASTDEQAVSIVAASFQQRLVTATGVRMTLDRMPRARRRGLVGALLVDLAGGAGSLPEAQFLRICRRAGFPRPKLQVSRRDATGRRRYLDAYFEEYAVHVEIDGGQHREVVAWWADMKRQNDLWITGDRVLRFPSWVVRARPDEVVAQVRAALRAAGWPG
jgi:very-short-patch-repair endonuclease